MRGPDIHQETLFSTVVPEQRVPNDHPLRPIREMVNEALANLDEDFKVLRRFLWIPESSPPGWRSGRSWS